MEEQEEQEKRPIFERNVFATEDDVEEEIQEEATPLERDVLGPKDGRGNAIKLGKGFRSNELSEEDLKEREQQAPKEKLLEETWSNKEAKHFLQSTLGQVTISALSLFVITGIWALLTLGSKETAESSEQRAKIIVQQNLDARTTAELEVQQEINIKLYVKNYLEATTYEERAKWCRNPAATLKNMMAHQGQGYKFQKYHYTGELIFHETFLAGGIPIVIASASNLPDPNSDESEIEIITLLLEAKSDGSVAIDWETDAIYQPDDWDKFISTKSAQPKTFRVEVRDSNNIGPYLFPFQNDQAYQAYRVNIRDKPDSYLLAYAKKNSEIDTMLKQALKIDPSNKIRAVSEHSANMILTLSFPNNADSDQCVEIIEIKSQSWFQP